MLYTPNYKLKVNGSGLVVTVDDRMATMNDVTLTGITNGQVLSWNSTSS